MDRPFANRPIRLSSAARALVLLAPILLFTLSSSLAGTRLDATRHQLDSLARVQEQQRGRLSELSNKEAGGLARLDRLEEQGASRRRLCRQLETEIQLLELGEVQQSQELELSLLRQDSLSRSQKVVRGHDASLRRESAALARRLFPLRRMDSIALWLSTAGRERESRSLRLLPWLAEGLRHSLARLAGVQQLLQGLEEGTARESRLHRELLVQKARDKVRAGQARQEAGRELGRLQVEEAEQGRLLGQVRKDKALAAEQAERLRRAGNEVARQVADLQRRWTEHDSRRVEEGRRQQAVAGRLGESESPAAPSAAPPPPKTKPAAPQVAEQGRASRPEGGLLAMRGRLPSPVGGRVSRPFGTRQDAALGTTLDNPGVDYACAPGSAVKAVHDGRVEKVTWVAGFGNTVLLSHGDDCWTVYAKLEDVDVREGQAVQGGQALGRAGRFDQAGEGAVHFELWQDRQARDPRQWLRP